MKPLKPRWAAAAVAAAVVAVLLALVPAAMAAEWSAWVQPPDTEGKIQYRAKFESGTVSTVSVEAEHAEHWHTYALDNLARGGSSIETVFRIEGGLKAAGAWVGPTPSDLSQDVGGVKSVDFGYQGTVTFTLAVERGAGDTATVYVAGQTCADFCYPPYKDVAITISLPAAEKPVVPSAEQPKAAGQVTGVAADGWTPWLELPRGATLIRVKYRARIESRTKAGGTGGETLVAVEAVHTPGFHTYAFDNGKRGGAGGEFSQTAITVSGGAKLTGDWKAAPEAHDIFGHYEKSLQDYYKSDGKEHEWAFEGTVVFSAPAELVGSRIGGTSGGTVTLTFKGQACNADGCADFKDEQIVITTATLVVVDNEPTSKTDTTPTKTDGAAPSKTDTAAKTTELPPKTAEATASPTASQLYQVESEGKKRWVLAPFGGEAVAVDASWGAFLFACFIGGLIALLMPCVYPMIPITVSFFGKQAAKTGKPTVGLAMIYGIGLMASYTGLGFLLTAILGASGVTDFGNNAWVAIAIGAFFLVFSLSMFGMFELRLPYGVAQKFNVQGKSGGAMGAFLLGLTFAVTSMACTVPVVGSILALATEGQIAKPVVGMLVYSGTVALPFILLGSIPGAMNKLPKAGGWMNSIKVVFGFIELAAAAEFFGWARIISREMVLAVWIACFVLAGLYLLGRFRSAHDAPVEGVGAGRMLAAALFIGIALWFSTGLYGGKLGFIESFLITEVEGWQKNPDLYPALEAAEDKRKGVFLDFTAVN